MESTDKSYEKRQLEQHSVEELSNPSTSSSLPVCAKKREDFLEKAFRIPTVSKKSPKRPKSLRPRPPAVATSDEFKAWFKQMEQNKENEEQKRQEKKAARESKKQRKQTNLTAEKERPKPRTTKSGM